MKRGVASPDWQDKWVPRKPRPYDGRERKGRGLSWPRPSARAGGAGKGRGERGGGARGGGWELRTPQHGTPARSLEPPTPRRPHPTAAPLCSPLSPWLWGGGGTPTRRAPQPTQEAPHVCAPPVGFTPPTPPLSPPRTPEAPTWGAQCFPAPHVGHPPPPVGVGLAVGTLCAYGGGGGGGVTHVCPPAPLFAVALGICYGAELIGQMWGRVWGAAWGAIWGGGGVLGFLLPLPLSCPSSGAGSHRAVTR